MAETLFDAGSLPVREPADSPLLIGKLAAIAEIPIEYEGDLPIEVHYTHAATVLDILMEAFNANRFPYNDDSVRKPHDERHMPQTLPRGGLEHASFLWAVCYYMRGGIKSNVAVMQLSKMFDKHPKLFAFEHAASSDVDVAMLAATLREYGLGFQDAVAKAWKENARRMVLHYNGDPRNIFNNINTYEDALARIANDSRGNGFIGFKEKMTSMILYYLMDDELIDTHMFPIPVDFHVARVSIANEFITFPNVPQKANLYRPETLAALRSLYVRYAQEHNVNPLRLCDAVWLLSSNICSRYPGNTTLEPLGSKKRTGRSTILLPQIVDHTDQTQREAYTASCARCPVETWCRHSIAARPYYINGCLYIRGERIRMAPFDDIGQDGLFDL